MGCSYCGGTGWDIREGLICSVCDGDGDGEDV